jgi:drug/metabolite transporter (DMT)-like permease
MAMFGGEKVSVWQAICIVFVVAGLFVQALDLRRLSSLVGVVGPSVFLNIVVGMMGNCCYSLRNIVLSHAADLLPSMPKIMLFGTTCLLALLPSLCLLSSYLPTGELNQTSVLLSHPWLVLGSASAFVLYNLASFLVLLRTKPVRHGMFINGKRIASVLLACVIAHEIPTVLEFIGLLTTTLGIAMFERMKSRDEKPPTAIVEKAALPSPSTLNVPNESAEECKNKSEKSKPLTLIQRLLLSDSGFNIFFAIIAVCGLTVAPFIINTSDIAKIQEGQMSL